ncbi:hypothetical protein KBY82_09435 [Cyanobium sp. AMD-g]|uniref:hypothetical protein n=1 Tax=Cyanobium sp. AMD-g TaxID=2823699 RepID=UPI0020CDFF56|nr:hypothetical protein [Cyanobium sp. AMD-g]MCP9931006.1 hypothetical protein [Cyanobium sp. AMD-g]
MRIIVTGLIAQYPLGGVAWDYLQYLLGLSSLGHEVYYFEDTGQWPYNPHEGGVSAGCEYNVQYLSGIMDSFGFSDRWAYKFTWEAQWFGLSEVKRQEIVGTADVLINVSGSLVCPSDYRAVKKLVYIDSDPVFTQVKLARGQQDFRRLIDCHDIHFSFGETLSGIVPSMGYNWIPTRQPVAMGEWENEYSHQGVFTTVMNWSSYKPVTYNGLVYGQKDIELMKFIDLPQLVSPYILELAINAGKVTRTPKDRLVRHGWKLVDPDKVCPDYKAYRSYIMTSMAEWSVAKNGYVQGLSGWFSCRSACYLAAGRPAVLQDTGFSKILPVGDGLLSFTTQEEAVQAIDEVNSNYSRHRVAAREIASAYFDAKLVLARLLNQVFSRVGTSDCSKLD